MANKTAVYRDEHILGVVEAWFKEAHNNEYGEKGVFVTVHDLYQSYCEYTIGREYISARMTMSQFAKCLAACKIVDIGGRWRYIKEYQPTNYDLTRATV